jgi:hypothetical protein
MIDTAALLVMPQIAFIHSVTPATARLPTPPPKLLADEIAH